MLQEKSSVSEVYEHVRDGGNENDAQTMDAATENQRQMMQMTDIDNVNNTDNDDDAGKPDAPPEIENDVIQVIASMYCNCTSVHCNCMKLLAAVFSKVQNLL